MVRGMLKNRLSPLKPKDPEKIKKKLGHPSPRGERRTKVAPILLMKRLIYPLLERKKRDKLKLLHLDALLHLRDLLHHKHHPHPFDLPRVNPHIYPLHHYHFDNL